MTDELICQRCKKPLVNDVAIPGHDGRMICARGSCQYVEEMSRQIDEGTLELMDPKELAVDVKFPTGLPPVELETHVEMVLIRPIGAPVSGRMEPALTTREQIHEDLAEIISEWSGEPPERLTPETDLTRLLDSFDMLDVVMDAEDEFGVSINDEDAAKVVTMAEAVDLIHGLRR